MEFLVKPNVNDIVLIEDENMKKLDWRIEKIEKLLHSKGGEVRSPDKLL